MILISVITVCRNALSDLIMTSASVTSQTSQNFEYLVIDGASEDGTGKYLAAQSSMRFIVEEDAGIYDAMNKGIELALGQYICFLNAGDRFIHKDAIMKIENCIKTDKSIDLVYSDVVYEKLGNRIVKQHDNLSRIRLYGSGICHQAWFLKREVYKSVGGFDLTYSIMGDYDILLKLILDNKITYKHYAEELVCYKGDGMSLKHLDIRRGETISIKRNYFKKSEVVLYDVIARIFKWYRRIY
jgi:putative colanic acid biosynthesis glycosyltransferase